MAVKFNTPPKTGESDAPKGDENAIKTDDVTTKDSDINTAARADGRPVTAQGDTPNLSSDPNVNEDIVATPPTGEYGNTADGGPAVVTDVLENVNQNVQPIVEAAHDADVIERVIARPAATGGKPYKVYKHRGIRSFHVGEFHFVNNLLFIQTKEQDDKFLEYYDGLMDVDKNSIVEFNYEAAASLEKPIAPPKPTVSRGALSTKGIPDSKVLK